MALAGAKLWKESATLILLARNSKAQVKTDKFDYKVLVLKRSAKSGFMPCSLVFPGGVIEKGDSSRDWLALYESLGVSSSSLKRVTHVSGERPPIFQYKPSELEMKREISLRISCIRETFEELGVLLCRDKEDIQREAENESVASQFATFKSIEEVKNWQTKVHNDHNEFIHLCETHSLVPDIWGTHEWSAWLTPTALKGPRFEAAFYLAAVNEVPEVYAEKTEVQNARWNSPSELLELHDKEQEWLPPPQHYELSRLAGVERLDNVATFAKQRSNKGTKLFYPIFVNAKDGIIHLLPGDKHYPEKPNLENGEGDAKHQNDIPMEKQRPSDGPVHRTEHRQRFFKMQLVVSEFEPHCGHLKPIINTKPKPVVDSKLKVTVNVAKPQQTKKTVVVDAKTKVTPVADAKTKVTPVADKSKQVKPIVNKEKPKDDVAKTNLKKTEVKPSTSPKKIASKEEVKPVESKDKPEQ